MAVPAPPTVSPNTRPLCDALASLYDSADYADLVIKCFSRQWNAHQAIICSQSRFFTAVCKKKHTAKTGVITLGDEEEVVETLIKFLYQSTYSDEWCTDPEANYSSMVFNLKMVIAANQYDVPVLEELAMAKLMIGLDQMADLEDLPGGIQVLYRDSHQPFPIIRAKVLTLVVDMLAPTTPIPNTSDLYIDDLTKEFPVFDRELSIALTAQWHSLRGDVERREQILIEQHNKQTKSMQEEKAETENLHYALFGQRQDQLKELKEKEAELEQRETALELGKEAHGKRVDAYWRWCKEDGSERTLVCSSCRCTFVIARSLRSKHEIFCPICKDPVDITARQSRWEKSRARLRKDET